MHHLTLTSDPQGDPATALPYAFPPRTTLPNAGAEYAIDAWQRNVLFADVMRERGNQYQAHLHERTPNVLDFAAELILDGRTLPRPVSYGLVRIISPDDLRPDRNATEAHDAGRLRPFIVFDPHAGHGPGIGGFKRDSEIGAALRAGHPCYFVGFLPDPVPGQTVEDVMHAEATFLEKVIELHPDSPGKPMLLTNSRCSHAAPICEQVCRQADWLGIALDAGANARGEPRISAPSSKVPVWVIPTNEELMIASHTRSVIGTEAL